MRYAFGTNLTVLYFDWYQRLRQRDKTVSSYCLERTQIATSNLRTFQDKLMTWWCVASLVCATLRVELQLQPDTRGESREDQISNAKCEWASHKAIRQHRLQCRSMLSNNFMTSRVSSAVCHSLSHCTLTRVAAVDLIGHRELYGVMSKNNFPFV